MSATVNTQPRQQAGTPTGGQWVPTGHSDPDVTLTDDTTMTPPGDETPNEFDDIEPGPPTYDIAAASVERVQNSIKKANRRLAKAGITDRFNATYEPYTLDRVNRETGVMERHERCAVTLNRPVIAYDGYEFAARIEQTESGKLIALTAPDQELHGWTPQSMACEHCGQNRRRTKVYVVRNPEGEYKTIGSNCLENYTGIKPEGLWALTYDDLNDIQDDDNWDLRGGPTGGTPIVPGKDVLAVAAAAAKVQGGYKAKWADEPTTVLVKDTLFPWTGMSKERKAVIDQVRQEAEHVDVDALRDEIREAVEPDGDWGTNVHALLDEEWVSSRHAALLASSISSVERLRAKKRERETTKPGFIAPVGEKVTGVKARILKLRQSTNYYGYRETVSEMVRLQTDDGHIVTWWASSPTGFDEGDDVTIQRATVKDHETYRGEDQTIITRAKLELVEPPTSEGDTTNAD